jgi:hypothetical protein
LNAIIANDVLWRRPTEQAVTTFEREIDERVYRLYGLTAEERKLVEESSAQR